MSHHNFSQLCIAFSDVSMYFCFLKLMVFGTLDFNVGKKKKKKRQVQTLAL